MVLKTLATIGASPATGWRAPSRDQRRVLSLNYGTIYPALLKLEQEGAIAAEWGTSEKNRRARSTG